ncbi:MAG: acetate--CoA ligase family protein, partial [Syntrophorhabdaceae bacterium]|nr:acetate--CoA ligase family protein [Syntrophorhabdaceae bacterium]
MLREEILTLLAEASSRGWLMEPQAKQVFRLSGLDVTRFLWTKEIQEATRFAAEIGYPVVAKVVSP